jgi:WD40 repeat protein
VSTLADALARSGTPLAWLSVASNRLGAPATTALLHGLARITPPTIEHLDLSENQITEAPSAAFDTRAIAALSALLCAQGCAMRTLRLKATQLCGRDGDAGYVSDAFSMLCDALRECSAPLQHVCLSSNLIRNSEAAQLGAMLTERRAAGRPRLSLDLSTNSLSSSTLGELYALCALTASFQKPLCDRTFLGFDKCVYAAATDEHAIYLAHGGGPIIKVSLTDWKELGRLEGHTDDTNCIHLHGDMLVSGSDDYSVKLWTTELSAAGEGHCLATLSGHEARVWSLTATDEHIYSCSADKRILVWSMADAKRGVATQLARLTSHTDVVSALCIAFGALFSSSADKTIRRYRLGGGHEQTLCWDAHAHAVTCLAASERMQLLCSGAEDGRISLWRLGPDSASCVGTLSARQGNGSRAISSNLAVYTLAISPMRGDVLFAGGADYRVHMYNLCDRTLLHTLTGHTSTVRALTLTPSGDRLCSSGGDFNVLVWRLPSEERTDGATSATAVHVS